MLTEAMVEAATHAGEGASWDVRWDGADGVPGFGVRVYPSGRKSYLVIYRVGGRRRTYTIGSTSRIALEAARDRAKRIALEASDGFDPLAERRRSRGVGTFGELCDVYVEEYAKPLKATWKEDERRIEKHVRSALGSKAAGAITADDVRYLHREITRRSPIEANRVLALVSRIWTFGRGRGLVASDAENPASGVLLNSEQRRMRWIRPAEMRRLAAAVQNEEDLHVRAAIWISLLIGCRKRELLSTRWRDVNLASRELVIHDPKGSKTSGEPKDGHTYALPAVAVAILDALPRETAWVFPSPRQSGSGHRTDVRAAWRRIRTAAGLEDVRWQDLRYSTGSWLASSGGSPHLMGSVLGHRDAKVTEAYAQIAATERLCALEGVSQQIFEAAGVDAEMVVNGIRPSQRDASDADDHETIAARLRAEAEAMLEHAERRHQETRFAAIDLLKRAEEISSGG